MRLTLINGDRLLSAAFGGLPSVYDHCYVLDEDLPAPNWAMQRLVYSGELYRAHAFKRQAETIGAVTQSAFDAARTATDGTALS